MNSIAKYDSLLRPLRDKQTVSILFVCLGNE